MFWLKKSLSNLNWKLRCYARADAFTDVSIDVSLVGSFDPGDRSLTYFCIGNIYKMRDYKKLYQTDFVRKPKETWRQVFGGRIML